MIQPHIQRRAVQQILQAAGRNVGTDLRVQRHHVMRCLSAVGTHHLLPRAPPPPFVNNFGPDRIRYARGFPPLGGLPAESNESVAPSSGSSGFMTTLDFDLTRGEEDDDGG
mmetsp:Transcript_13921/g.26628  ORF Transcript_13921/g.26628 Transcript_13921/m.26628 type:complete len:111 (-) Transcript_13921:275-607(-)|eukprot:scaffold2791_cov154-Amphora_coffeaeformis.AAC.11